MTHTAKIRAKGLDATGVTEDIARSMSARLGAHTLMIVEVNHSAVTTTDDGDTQVALNITTCEPVPVELEDTVRDLQRALYRQRPEVAGQIAMTGVGDGPNPEEAATAVNAHIERDESGEVSGVWSGDDDQSVTAGKGTALSSVPPIEDDGTPDVVCDFPGCFKAQEHDGEHGIPGDPEGP